MNREDNLYDIKNEFQKIKDITKETIKKHPDRKEQILVDFSNMCLRNEIANSTDIIILFNDNGIKEEEIYKKYHLDNSGMCKR